MLLNILLLREKEVTVIHCKMVAIAFSSRGKEIFPYFCVIHIIDIKIKICFEKYSVCKVILCYFPENHIFHN